MKKLFLILLVVILFSCEREEVVYPDEETLQEYKTQGEKFDLYITKKELNGL